MPHKANQLGGNGKQEPGELYQPNLESALAPQNNFYQVFLTASPTVQQAYYTQLTW
jgi:hypothetical protein